MGILVFTFLYLLNFKYMKYIYTIKLIDNFAQYQIIVKCHYRKRGGLKNYVLLKLWK